MIGLKFWTIKDMWIDKVFDTPPRQLLKNKLFSYRIGGTTLKWIDSYLCFRQQGVVVTGVKSE